MTENQNGATVVQDPRVTLTPDRDGEVATGGTVLFRAHLNGRWVGWVGDSRKWRGHRYGARRWWACHRQDGDRYARGRVDDLATRKAATEWLSGVAQQTPDPGVAAYLEATLAGDQTWKDLSYTTAFLGALVKAGRLMEFDPARLAAIVDEDEAAALVRYGSSVARYVETFQQHRDAKVIPLRRVAR